MPRMKRKRYTIAELVEGADAIPESVRRDPALDWPPVGDEFGARGHETSGPDKNNAGNAVDSRDPRDK